MRPESDLPNRTKGEAPAQAAPADEDAARAARRLSHRRALYWMLAVVALAVAVRLPLLAFPMGESAGTAAYVGQRWLDGAVPYRDAWDYRAPGLYLLSGIIARRIAPLTASAEEGVLRLFQGSKAMRVRVGEAIPETGRLVALAIDLATVLLVYQFVRRWCKRTEAVVAAGVCAFFGGAMRVQGDCLDPQHAMTLFVALSMLAALRSDGQRWPWLALSGLAAGLATCFEALAVLYLLALMAWVVATNGGSRSGLTRWVLRPAVMLLAGAAPVGAFVLYFWLHGALGELWRSAVVYNVLYRWLPLAAGEARHWSAIRSLAPEQGALWLFAIGWVLHAFSMGFGRETGLVALWGVVAVAAAMATRRVETSHFFQAVPPLAIGAALALTNPSEPFLQRDARGRIETRSALLLVMAGALAFGFLYVEWRVYLAQAASDELTTPRAVFTVADLIHDNTWRRDPIYVFGWHPQIYVLADRPAAHRYFYSSPLVVSERLRKEYFGPNVFSDILGKLKKEEPPFIVAVTGFLPADLDRERLAPEVKWSEFIRKRYVPWKVLDVGKTTFTVYAREDHVPRELP